MEEFLVKSTFFHLDYHNFVKISFVYHFKRIVQQNTVPMTKNLVVVIYTKRDRERLIEFYDSA